MPREKLYDRKTDAKSARVFVIACEGEQTEMLYFNALTEGLRRVRCVPLPAFDGLSAPEHVIDRLNDFVAKRGLPTSPKPGDGELWIVIDVDHWFAENRIGVTHQVLDEAAQRGYHVAVSNKCFEAWLLYHFEDVKAHTAVKTLEQRLRTHLGGYRKNHLNFDNYRPRVYKAMQRAKDADSDPDNRIPANPGSRVYRLLEAMQAACGTAWPYQD